MDARDGMGEDEIILFFGFFWEEVIGNAPFSKAADLFFFCSVHCMHPHRRALASPGEQQRVTYIAVYSNE